jgi:drug/metabolite transporter (DMT)-like permease
MFFQLKKILPVLSILGAVFLWGSSFSAMRFLLMELSPFTVMFCRIFTAFIFIIPVARKLKLKNYHPGDWKILLPMVLFQPCLYFLFESNALTFTTSAQAGIISACLPLMVAAAAWGFLSETISSKTITGLILSIAGVIVLTVFQSRDTQASAPLLGNFLEILAMASACGNMILVKKLSLRYDPWSLTFMQVCAGLIFFSPGAFSVIRADWSFFTLQVILMIIYLGVCVSFFSFGLYNWGISKIDASKASVFINLIPITAVALGWLFLGETLNTLQIIAGGTVILGVVISNTN